MTEQVQEQLGARCPECQCSRSLVHETRQREGKVQRVRECLNCGGKFYTTEQPTGAIRRTRE
jgi:transcriptional regulator NrdR family protein